MRILFPNGNPNWMKVFDDLGSLPVPPGTGDGSVAVIKDDGSGNFAGMLWNGTTWVQAFGPAIVDTVINNLRLHNFAAVIDPTSSDDSDDGYEVGSRWINLSTPSHWVLVDDSVGSAVWLRTDNTGSGGTFLDQKAGVVPPGSFSLSGGVQTATVTFSTAFPDPNYSVALGVHSNNNRRYTPHVTSKTASAFTMSLGSAVATDLVAVQWVATRIGEST